MSSRSIVGASRGAPASWADGASIFRIGQTFDGLITTVMEFGCFIQLLEVGVDGLLPLAALQGDDYQMAREGGQWIGTRSARRLGPGVRLRVIVAAVKPVEGQIDLELAED